MHYFLTNLLIRIIFISLVASVSLCFPLTLPKNTNICETTHNDGGEANN